MSITNGDPFIIDVPADAVSPVGGGMVRIDLSGYFPDAPDDDSYYVRGGGAWVPISNFIGGDVSTYTGIAVENPTPRVQIDGSEGQTWDHEVITSGTGSVSFANGLIKSSSGTGIGSFCAAGSDALINVRPGQTLTADFSAMFSSPVSGGFQMIGLFGSVSALAVGWQGVDASYSPITPEFGFLRRIPGVRGIYRLTVTTGTTSGAQTLTLTLGGVAYNIPLSGGLSATLTAEGIANSSVWNSTPWRPSGLRQVSPTANTTGGVSVVTFLQNTPGTVAGAFSFASTGTAAASWTTVAAGAPNDDYSGFVPISQWTGTEGLTVDPTKLNDYRIVLPYGASDPEIWVRRAGVWTLGHRIPYSDANTTPNQGIPAYKLRCTAASLGSATDIWSATASMKAQIDGMRRERHRPAGRAFNNFQATTEERIALAFRVRSEFNGITCGREIAPIDMHAFSGTANRVVTMRFYLNPTITGSLSFQYHNKDNSALEYATPAAGSALASAAVDTPLSTMTFGSGPAEIDLIGKNIRAQPGDIIAVTVQTDASSATTGGGNNISEG